MGEIDDELKFKRYLYFMSEAQHCVVKRSHDHSYDLLIPSLMNLLSEEKFKRVLDIIETANNDPSFPDRNLLFYIIMNCAKLSDDIKIKTLAYEAISKLLRTTKEFFLFLKFNRNLTKNMPSGVKKVVRNFYLKPNPTELYEIITRQNSFHGWSHLDAIRLAHLKTDSLVQNVLLCYACRGLEEAKKKVTDNKDMTPEIEDIFKKLEALDEFKHCQDEKKAASMIKEHGFQVQQMSSKFLRSQIVWEALVPQMEIPEVIKELGRFHKLGFYKANNPVVTKITEVLTDPEKCKKCKIYPAAVLIEMKTFERGKPVDPNLKQYLKTLQPDKSPTIKIDACTQTTTITNSKEKPEVVSKSITISNAFGKLLNSSFRNPTATGKRIMITIDTRQPCMMNYTFGVKTVTCLEAATVLTLSLMRSEKDVTVASFNGDSVNIVQLAKGMTFNQVHQKLKETPTNYVMLSKPFQWATEKNKHIDVFINIMYTGDAPTRIPKEVKETLAKDGKDVSVLAAFKKYKSKMKLINSKLINISLAGRVLELSDGSKGTLDINGFNANVPKMIEAFCKGSVL